MKHLHVIALLFGALMVACNRPVETQNLASPPRANPALQAVDSLMWTRPDSALALLLDCRDGVRTVSTAYDRHYANLLLSELLYKNDYGQTNREELLKAVDYFDSLMIATDTRDADTRGVSLHRAARRDTSKYEVFDGVNVSATDAQTLAFLDARAHYINGVGHYERDSVVEACKEYLKALEVMEGRFEEKELIGKKAQFMAYICSRLGEMFSDQLLAEPSITCYKKALFYCRREPTSKYGIPVLLYSLGIQYDIANQKDSAAFYYDEALANMPDFDNLHYRDLWVNKILFAYYYLNYSPDSLMIDLKRVIALSEDEDERMTRLLTLGNILFEDKQYDSSRVYLETVFEQQKDLESKMMAAENLCDIYQIKGDSIKAQRYASFLAGFTLSEMEKKKDVSRINEMFKDYMGQKQERRAELEREKAVKKALWMFIPLAIVVALVVFIVAKLRNKKQLREQQAEAKKLLEDKERHHQRELETKEAKARKELEEKDKQHAEVLEAERQTHRMEQAAMSGRLKRSNQELRELKGQIKHLDDLAAKTESATSFNEEPICRLIMERVNEGQFKSKIDYIIYKDSALDKQQLLDLRLAVDRHFGQFTARLKKAYPELTNGDLDYCCLYLLGLTDADIAALMQRTYNTVFHRNGKMRKIFGSENPLPVTLMGMAKDSSFI